MNPDDYQKISQLLTQRDTFQKDVNIFNMVSSNSLAQALFAHARPNLENANAQLSSIFQRLENNLNTLKSQVASNVSIVNDQKSKVTGVTNQINSIKSELSNLEVQNQSLQTKISEVRRSNQLKQKEYYAMVQAKLDLINSMTPKQHSFILQKALEAKNDEIISLFINTELDPNFKNAEGISLIQTAQDMHNQQVIDVLGEL